MFQPCDVGMQRILKHSLKRSYHKDIVQETLDKLNCNLGKIVLDNP